MITPYLLKCGEKILPGKEHQTLLAVMPDLIRHLNKMTICSSCKELLSML